MNSRLWDFTDDSGDFESTAAVDIRTLYFPLANDRVMSSITPDLHGDIKAGQDRFLLTPTSRIDLINLRSSRNFWIAQAGGRAWSATGVSKDRGQIRSDEFRLRAGLLWHEVTRRNRSVGLEASVLSFVPVSGDPLEVMRVAITNISPRPVEIVPTAAIPIYGRGANNLRDHRHVTSLLQRPRIHRYGVVTKPTLSFDEAGHRPNRDIYFVLGWDDDAAAPEHIYPTEEAFCGDGGDLEAPEAVFGPGLPPKGRVEGEEPMGALMFRRIRLKPGGRAFYTVVMGICDQTAAIDGIVKRYRDPSRLQTELLKTKERWTGLSELVTVDTPDRDFNRWFRWVSIQPTLRKIYGCSFLPDFDYGKGGRGWRDLWQDCLGLILGGPDHVRGLLVNNFAGVRIDGSNATIIGSSPGEFLSDRNNISRVWMDHGVWPLLTMGLYLDEIGDSGILFEKVPYFRSHEVDRAGRIDREWCAASGRTLKTRSGRPYKGTILEHLIVQNLVQFFNVGSHNHVKLEGADWNDGLDMARENGESVAFSAMYSHNLGELARIIDRLGTGSVELAEEITALLRRVDPSDPVAKRRALAAYFAATRNRLSGRTVMVDAGRISSVLRERSRWMAGHIRKREWLKEGFFNGYYDDSHRRVEGLSGGRVRMMLGSQVFPIMGGVADDDQISAIMKSAGRYLWDRSLKGYRLNTDFGSEKHDLGRAFSFVYGNKENGAFFNHMVVMFAYALYRRGRVSEAWRALDSIYRMAVDTGTSKIYPCLPEYFNLEGRGMYTYLTGSASWFILTMLTQVFGVSGKDGDLAIEPKLCREQFGGPAGKRTISVTRSFAGRRICVSYSNPVGLDWDEYRISAVRLNGRRLPVRERRRVIIPRLEIAGLPPHRMNLIEVSLDK